MIEIIQPGIMTTVQDLGRYGYRNIGVATSGAMDISALKIANCLVGNVPGAAALEIALTGIQLRFHADMLVSLTGIDVQAELDGVPFPAWWALKVKAGQTLTTSMQKKGMYSYLAFQGGIDVPMIMGSRSTDLKGGFGGHCGRCLKPNDRLSVLSVPGQDEVNSHIGIDARKLGLLNEEEQEGTLIRIICAAEWQEYPKQMQETFLSSKWKIMPDSSRMGYRLSGPEIKKDTPKELLSHGILPGTVQLPPSGQPIIQLNDANTCGGYPKLGVVIAADMRKLAQTYIGHHIRFSIITREEAIIVEQKRQDFFRNLDSRFKYIRNITSY